jgi:hypothetical protein
MKMIELKKAFGSMPFNGLIALCLAAVVGAVSGCESIFPDDNKEEQAKQDSITVASTPRYGDPNVIITDKNGNPIPGPNGGSLKASDIPTNPNIKFSVLDSIASMAKTLGLPTPEKGQILYGISTNGNLATLDLNKLSYKFDEDDKSLGDYGTLTAIKHTFKEELPDGRVVRYDVGTGALNNIPVVFVERRVPMEGYQDKDIITATFYVNKGDRVEVYNYAGEKFLGYLEKSDKPNTYVRYMYEHDEHGEITGPLIRTEVPVGFIFLDQPEDDPSSGLAYTNSRGERTLANVMNSFDPKQRSKNNSLNTVY